MGNAEVSGSEDREDAAELLDLDAARAAWLPYRSHTDRLSIYVEFLRATLPRIGSRGPEDSALSAEITIDEKVERERNRAILAVLTDVRRIASAGHPREVAR